MTDQGIEMEETNPYLKPEYLMDITQEDLIRSGIAVAGRAISEDDDYYPGCVQYIIRPKGGNAIAIVVVSPDTGRVYLKTRFGDVRDLNYKKRVMAEIIWALGIVAGDC